MTSMQRPWVEVAARLLEPVEREVVLGDLLEAGEGSWPGLLDVLGLVIRRQLLHWKKWQPWLALFGLALPASLILMGVSVSVSLTYERLIDHRVLVGSPQAVHEVFLQLLCRGLLLIGCSWTCGFAVGYLSRRTLWVSIAPTCVPCLFCLVRFREPSLSRLCLFLFLLPAIWGVRQALRPVRINLAFATLLAIAITTWMILPWGGRGLCSLNWSLVWPAWYIVAASPENGGRVGRGLKFR